MSNGRVEASTRKLFAIEDNPADVRLVKEGVDTAAVELDLEVINSGQEAVERFSGIDSDTPELYPNLVLLDLNLPGKSGFEVLEMIRTETAFQDVPVVVVSSSENRDDVGGVYELGANAYTVKPADPDEYIQMIQAAIEFWITNVSYPSNNE